MKKKRKEFVFAIIKLLCISFPPIHEWLQDVHFLQVACSIVHNSPSPIPNDRFHPQRRHSAISHAYPGRFLFFVGVGIIFY